MAVRRSERVVDLSDMRLAIELYHHFKALPGRLIVLMDEVIKRYGALHLPESMTEDPLRRNNMLLKGTVVSSGSVLYRFGDRVMVRPWEGLHVGGGDPTFPMSRHIPAGREVRFYRPYPTDTQATEWRSLTDQVPVTIDAEQ